MVTGRGAAGGPVGISVGWPGSGLECPSGQSPPLPLEAASTVYLPSLSWLSSQWFLVSFKADSVHISRPFIWVHISVSTPFFQIFHSLFLIKRGKGHDSQETPSGCNLQVVWPKKSLNLNTDISNNILVQCRCFSYNKTILTGIIALGYKIIYKEKNLQSFSKRCGYMLDLMSYFITDFHKIETLILKSKDSSLGVH